MRTFIDSIETAVAAGFARLERTCATDDRSLAWFRVFWGVFLLLFATPYVSWVARVPPGFFDPPRVSVAAFFDTFPPAPVFIGGDILLVTLILAITLGVYTRVATWLFVFTHTVLFSFHYAFGKIDHEILLVAVTLCLGFTNWGARLALRPDRAWSPRVTRRALAIAGLAVAFGMATAAHEKIVRWVDFDLGTSGFLAWFYGGYLTLGRTYLAAPLVPHVPPGWFELADYAAVAFELGAGVALWVGARAWRTWLLIACLFHLGNTALLNIPFLVHVPVYLMFLAVPAHWPERVRWWDRPAWRAAAIAVPVALWAAHVAQRLAGSGARTL
ncbi:MAG TPA: hypothetical protein VHF69_06200, partial [Candidatus Synoicihabitans sp.]|nr:hypothetical protein [Candidatus Synoicihabitans sp.]